MNATEGMTPENERRLIAVPISYRDMIAVFRPCDGEYCRALILRHLPEGYLVVRVIDDPLAARFVAHIWHPEFDEVAEGQHIPLDCRSRSEVYRIPKETAEAARE